MAMLNNQRVCHQILQIPGISWISPSGICLSREAPQRESALVQQRVVISILGRPGSVNGNELIGTIMGFQRYPLVI
jgi:hypothetical protein